MMKHNKELHDVVMALAERSLGVAFVLFENFALKHPELGVVQPFGDIRSDYNLMSGYWKQGYKDAHSQNLYNRIIERMYRLTADTYLQYTITHDTFMGGAYRRARSAGQDRSAATVRREMEGFVADLTLLGLEPENKRAARRRELYQAHQQQMTTLFDYILTSPQWDDGTAEDYTALLLSPTTDTDDRQLIVSAIMMSLLWVFDYRKWKTLVSVYRQTDDQQLRQRALVGWVITIGTQNSFIFPEQKTLLEELIDGDVAEELADLQMQMVYCANTDSDTRTIRDEIMPELIKNNNLRITPNGIEEKEDDPTEDLFDSHASEKRMAAMEEHFKRMMDMQKQGADIYFGGFAQMKRFPFFDGISNWFQPFSVDHPAIASLYGEGSELKLASAIVNRGSFCNSDKYSFVIAFQRIANQLPASAREMLSRGEMAMGMGALGADIDDEEKRSPAYIRRIYLQDLYRFFRLFSQREKYDSPFDSIFVSNSIFAETQLKGKALEMAAFMVKRKMLGEAESVLDTLTDHTIMIPSELDEYLPESLRIDTTSLYNVYMLRGYLAVHLAKDNGLALKWYHKALEAMPDSVKALSGYAKALMDSEDYEEAERAYRRVMLVDEKNITARFNCAQCLVKMEQYDQALELLYRLDYERPDNDRIQRLLTLSLLHTAKIDEAERIVDKLILNDRTTADDSLMKGIILWCRGEVEGAMAVFVSYLREVNPGVTLSVWSMSITLDIIGEYRDVLTGQGITAMDIQLMMDALCQEH